MIRRRRAVLLVTAMVAVMAAAFGSSSAMAAGVCTGTAIKGKGSSLQKIAQQEVWTVGFNTNAEGCNGAKQPKVTYESTGSGPGLEAWGVNTLNKAGKSGVTFIGTDDAPNKTQLEEIDISAESKGVARVAVVPVEQGAIAMIVDPPNECKVKENKITNEALQKIWSGETVDWSQIKNGANPGVEEVKAKACEVAIKRIVREEESGTTYQFKHYLFEIQNVPCAGGKSWEEYQTLAENTNWPTCAGGNAAKKEGKGGGGEATKVAETVGSIGYANLSDAKATVAKANYTWLRVQNQKGGKEDVFVYPGTVAGEPIKNHGQANCAETNYNEIAGKELAAEELNFDWSKVYGGHPGSVAGPNNVHYPICTLTWDLALNDYTTAKFPKPAEEFQTTADYLKYVVAKAGGQEEIRTGNKDYEELPEAPVNIAKIARGVVGKVADN